MRVPVVVIALIGAAASKSAWPSAWAEFDAAFTDRIAVLVDRKNGT